MAAALAAGSVGLGGLALWLGLFAVPTAAAVAFVAISDVPGYQGDYCGTVDCATCPSAPHVDDASSATCNTSRGYCEIAPQR